eukprot:2321542-Prymnesium_polylepis.1
MVRPRPDPGNPTALVRIPATRLSCGFGKFSCRSFPHLAQAAPSYNAGRVGICSSLPAFGGPRRTSHTSALCMRCVRAVLGRRLPALCSRSAH